MSFMKWIDDRLPIFSFVRKELVDYQTPKNLNYMWNFGSLAGICLVIMIITGIFLAMHYIPDATKAFDSVEHIMRDVNGGWLIRYIHMNGASIFFIVVYLHIARGLYYGSYKAPRELLWILGVFIFLAMMATAFLGYVLPWGQMSFWGATVITNLFSAFPFGEGIVQWLWGGFSVDQPTLNRFFALHYLLPFIIVGITVLHLTALHQFGSNNPLGVEKKYKTDTIPFHPYYTVKDLYGLSFLFTLWAFFVFFAPNFFGEPDNYIPANPMVTPEHIVPEWYFLPFYAILRAVPNKLLGVLSMFGAIIVLMVLPWLDRHPVKSGRFRPYFKYFYALFCMDVLLLGYVGANPPEGFFIILGQLATAYYFFHFLVLIPVLSKYEPILPLPESISSPTKKASAKKTIIVTFLALSSLGTYASANPGSATLEKQHWGFQNVTGTFDKAAAQRGFQVYKEVCSVCHGVKRVRFRELEALGFSPAQIKALAASYTISIINEEGEPAERKGLPSDAIPGPYANDNAARAANAGSLPPDLSLMPKARKHGPDYIYALLTHYDQPKPKGLDVPEGKYYNPIMPGGIIAMAPPLHADQVTYADGTKATVAQMARDVVEFLSWTAEPELEKRKQSGFAVVLYLLVLTILLYLTKRRIWSRIKE